jgi:DNA-binding transcriptional LysR family regulator
LDFNLNHLRSFIVVSRTGNLSAAAKELGTTQPNLGRQMTALEKEVNLVLFVRHSRGLALTKQGQDFLDLCQRIVGQLAQETNVIRDRDLEPQGKNS